MVSRRGTSKPHQIAFLIEDHTRTIRLSTRERVRGTDLVGQIGCFVPVQNESPSVVSSSSLEEDENDSKSCFPGFYRYKVHPHFVSTGQESSGKPCQPDSFTPNVSLLAGQLSATRQPFAFLETAVPGRFSANRDRNQSLSHALISPLAILKPGRSAITKWQEFFRSPARSDCPTCCNVYLP